MHQPSVCLTKQNCQPPKQNTPSPQTKRTTPLLEGSRSGSKQNTMATPKSDHRNLHWKDNNVGLNLLQKMGWKDGQGIGKRAATTTSSEGMRITKRQDSLGIGAKSATATLAEASSRSTHTKDFEGVLQKLHQHHPPSQQKQPKKKKKSSNSVAMTTSHRITNHKVRRAKFQAKTDHDYQAIFAGGVDATWRPHTTVSNANTTTLSDSETKRAEKKKRRKREKKQAKEAKRLKRQRTV